MKNKDLNDLWSAVTETPFGRLGIRTDESLVYEIVYLPKQQKLRPARNRLAQEVANQVTEYFKHPNFQFDLPLFDTGTVHQRKVWAAIRAIPVGTTTTYQQIARAIQSAPRAVGQACGANPFPLIVPCHRVVAVNSIGGFANATDGYLLAAKHWLLAYEGAHERMHPASRS